MSDGMKTRNFASPERMTQICNKALDVISTLVDFGDSAPNHDLYSWLSEEVGMTDAEIRTAGFDCVPDAEIEEKIIKTERFTATAKCVDGGSEVSGFPVFDFYNGVWRMYPSEVEIVGESIAMMSLDVIQKDDEAFCPNCNAQIGGYDDHTEDEPDPWHNVLCCPWCGQQLEWSKWDNNNADAQ